MVMGRGLMVVGGGGDGPMVGDCDPMGIGRGSDGRGFVFCGLWVIDLLVRVFTDLLIKGCESNLVAAWWVVVQ